jgi:ATP-dependent Zn protease
MNARELRRLEATAYHEAGHAVSSWELRVPFRWITIIPESDSLGHIRHREWPVSFQPDINSDRRTRDRMEARVITLFAGPAAEMKFTGRRNHIGAQSDYGCADNLASYFCGSNEELEAYLGWLRARAENLIVQPHRWHAVQMLVKTLMERRRVSDIQSRKIIRDAIAEYGRARTVERIARQARDPAELNEG